MHRGIAHCLAVTVFLAWVGGLVAQTPAPAVTKVTLAKLHCKGCAQTIANKVGAVPGVSQVRADLKAKALFVTHAPGKVPSPRGMWEAIEQANHTPVRMESPAATYISKPPA